MRFYYKKGKYLPTSSKFEYEDEIYIYEGEGKYSNENINWNIFIKKYSTKKKKR